MNLSALIKYDNVKKIVFKKRTTTLCLKSFDGSIELSVNILVDRSQTIQRSNETKKYFKKLLTKLNKLSA